MAPSQSVRPLLLAPTHSVLPKRAIRTRSFLCNRPRGVTVSTLDSESSDRGSNPREAFACVEDQHVCEAEYVFCCALKLLMWDWLLAQQKQTTHRTEELPTTTPSDAQRVREVVSNKNVCW